MTDQCWFGFYFANDIFQFVISVDAAKIYHDRMVICDIAKCVTKFHLGFLIAAPKCTAPIRPTSGHTIPKTQKNNHTATKTQPHCTTTKTQPHHHKNHRTTTHHKNTTNTTFTTKTPHHHKITKTPHTTAKTQTHHHKNHRTTTHHKNTTNTTNTTKTPHTTTKSQKHLTPPRKHKHTTTKTQKHHHENTTTPPQPHHHKSTKTQTQKRKNTIAKYVSATPVDTVSCLRSLDTAIHQNNTLATSQNSASAMKLQNTSPQSVDLLQANDMRKKYTRF